MVRGLRSRLSYANVMATLAVALALGGGGFALANISGSGNVRFGAEKGLSSAHYETVLALSGVGKLKAFCGKSTLIRFKNTSSKTLQLTRFREQDGDFDSDKVAAGEVSLETSFSGFPRDTVRYHVFRAGGDGTPMADIAASTKYPANLACASRTVAAQALSKG
jgi:hypothetical protein